MVKIVFFVALAMMAVAAIAAPAEEEESRPKIRPLVQIREEKIVPQPRLPRATCDLLSGFGVADSACAAHCIAKRFKGGWCDKGVCHCRR